MSAGPHIRLARIEERDELEALQRRASLVWEDSRAALEAHPEAIALPLEQILEQRAFVAEQAGRLLGFSVVLSRTDGDAELDGLFVEPASWKSGIGRRLVAQAEQRARQDGARYLCVIANPNALGFYVACGFDSCGTEQTQFGPAIRMRKRLCDC